MIESYMLAYHNDLDMIIDYLLKRSEINKTSQTNARAIRVDVLPEINENRIEVYLNILKEAGVVDHFYPPVANPQLYIIASEKTKILKEQGGFTRLYQVNESDKSSKTKDEIIKDLTIKQLKGTIFQLKYWWMLLLMSAILGFVSGNFELIVSWFS